MEINISRTATYTLTLTRLRATSFRSLTWISADTTVLGESFQLHMVGQLLLVQQRDGGGGKCSEMKDWYV